MALRIRVYLSSPECVVSTWLKMKPYLKVALSELLLKRNRVAGGHIKRTTGKGSEFIRK